MASCACVRSSGDMIERLFGTRRWKCLTRNIPAKLLGSLYTKANRLEWAKNEIFVLPRDKPPSRLAGIVVVNHEGGDQSTFLAQAHQVHRGHPVG